MDLSATIDRTLKNVADLGDAGLFTMHADY
jgi:hypothetical protein